MNLKMGVRTVCAHRRDPSAMPCVSACARKCWSILCGVPAHGGPSGRRSFLRVQRVATTVRRFGLVNRIKTALSVVANVKMR